MKTQVLTRYKVRASVTDEQLMDCGLSFAVKFAHLRSASFELDEIRPGFPSVFPAPVLTGTTREADHAETNGYRIPLQFCQRIAN